MIGINTLYKDIWFRSRLEAQWALYFDLMGIRWTYEPQGIILSSGDRYLPDFYLPDEEMWVEVKGSPLNEFDYDKAIYLVHDTNKPLLLLPEAPGLIACPLVIPGPTPEKHDNAFAFVGKTVTVLDEDTLDLIKASPEAEQFKSAIKQSANAFRWKTPEPQTV